MTRFVLPCALLLCVAPLGGADAPQVRPAETALSQQTAPSQPAIVGTTETIEHSLVRLRLEGVPSDTRAVWEALTVGADGLTDADGLSLDDGKQFIFTGAPGRWRVTATYFEDGSIGKLATQVVIRGKGPNPNPGPGPGPKPTPTPDLTGLAKQVYDAAKSVGDPQRAKIFADNYAGIVSGIAAGAYAGPFPEAKRKIIADLFAANDPTTQQHPAWKSLFAGELRGWMNDLERAGQLGSLEAVAARLADIEKGFREAAK